MQQYCRSSVYKELVQRQSTMLALEKNQFEERAFRWRCLTIMVLMKMLLSLERSQNQQSQAKNQKTSFLPLTQAKLWKCSFSTQFLHLLQCYLCASLTTKQKGHMSLRGGKCGAQSNWRRLIGFYSFLCSQLVIREMVMIKVQRIAIKPQAEESWADSLSKVAQEVSRKMIRRFTTMQTSGIISRFTTEISFCTLEISRIIPLLSVLACSSVTLTLQLISVKYSAASQAQFSTALSIGEKYQLSRWVVMLQPSRLSTFNSHARLYLAQQ